MAEGIAGWISLGKWKQQTVVWSFTAFQSIMQVTERLVDDPGNHLRCALPPMLVMLEGCGLSPSGALVLLGI